MMTQMGNGNRSESDCDEVIVSEHNALGDNRYFDTASQTSFQVDHTTQVRRTTCSSFRVASQADRYIRLPQEPNNIPSNPPTQTLSAPSRSPSPKPPPSTSPHRPSASTPLPTTATSLSCSSQTSTLLRTSGTAAGGPPTPCLPLAA